MINILLVISGDKRKKLCCDKKPKKYNGAMAGDVLRVVMFASGQFWTRKTCYLSLMYLKVGSRVEFSLIRETSQAG